MKKKILLIEDDDMTIKLYEKVFETANFEIEILGTCAEGIERIKEIRKGKREKPDLILLDLVLPDKNGIEVLEEVKRNPETKNILVFALTNYSEPKLMKDLTKKRVDKFLLKTDYTPHQLVNIIKESLE